MNDMMKDFVLPPLVLTIICVVVSFALVGTYGLTQPIILENAAKAAAAARAEVLPGATSFEEVTVEKMPEGGIDCYKDAAGNGYVITGSARGYGGIMKVMVGIKNDGSIAGIKVLEQSETAGLGTKVTEPTFMNQFIGKDVEMKDIQTISGATVSSRAFLNAVKSSYLVYGEAAGVTIATGGEPFRQPLTMETVQKIFPTAGTFTRVENELEAYSVDEGTGFVVVTTEPGFMGDIVAAVGFDTEGKIAGIVLTAIDETPEYGMQIAAPTYLEKYLGLSDITGVEKIAGSTITSEAFQKLVQKTIDAFPTVKTAKAPQTLTLLQSMMEELYGDAGALYGVEGAKYALKNDKATGVVMVTPGFGGDFEVAVVIANDGTIAKVALGKNEETDGYGKKCAEASYTDQFIGKSDIESGVEDIAGATITSKSFHYAVKQALELVKGAK